MKRVYITTILTTLAILLVFWGLNAEWFAGSGAETLKVGFIYENDGSNPYTYNFMLAERALAQAYPERVEIISRSNVPESETAEPLRDLVRRGCGIIFTNTYSNQVATVATEYPEVQFCQISSGQAAIGGVPANYHTFNGKIYQGRYVSGIAAGMKLREMIDSGDLAPEDALVGFVGSSPTAEVISGYTAFLLGVRSVVPEAVMRVRYTGGRSNYSLEKACAAALIDEGCIVIAQHTNTIGPAAACEEAAATRTVYHIGYHQNMIDAAPSTSLISTRVNWAPYITGAVDAVLNHRKIEKTLEADIHGNDASAGIAGGWVQILELNAHIAAEGTAEKLSRAVDAFRRGGVEVFKGDYTGVNPADPADTYDLRQGYAENAKSSAPGFGYILEDVITVEE